MTISSASWWDVQVVRRAAGDVLEEKSRRLLTPLRPVMRQDFHA
jgi:hypothetical protein